MQPPYKILDITTSLKIGGMANGLLQTLRHLDRERFQFSIYACYTDPPSITEELQDMGIKVIHAPDYFAGPLNYFRHFSKILKEHGPFDMVHAHPYTTSGALMFLAKRAGIPIRIAHAHNDHRTREAAQRVHKKTYNAFMRSMLRRYATAGLGVSANSNESMFGKGWDSDPRFEVIYGGTDFDAFEIKSNIPVADIQKPDGPVISLSGRLAHAKNPYFALDIFNALLKIEPSSNLLFIGDGELREGLEEKTKELGLIDKVTFAGMRSDVPALLRHYVDALLLPSFHEGLPRAAVEAQAAGLPVLTSTNITRECDYTDQVEFMNLDDSAVEWAKTLQTQLDQGKVGFDQALAHARQSDFDVKKHAANIADFYERQIKKAEF